MLLGNRRILTYMTVLRKSFERRLPMNCLIQGRQGSTDWKRIPSRPNVTSASQPHPFHWQLHGVKCSWVWHCWHWSVPSMLANITGASQWLTAHLEKEQPDPCPHLGGSYSRKDEWALLFKVIFSMWPCGTYIWGQGCKISQCTVAWVAGDTLAWWIHGWFVGEGLFADTLLYVSCYYLEKDCRVKEKGDQGFMT